MSFDAWVYFTQLGELAALADASPETSIILNHIGAPLGVGPYAAKRAEVFDVWSRAISSLAERPNVSVKLGGLGMPAYGFGFENRASPPSSVDLAEAWRPYLLHCIEAFGPDRSMFESNFPVDKQSCSYRVLWNAFKRIVRTASADEKRALFAGSARRLYRLPELIE
jgi:predicted TIM-barrel fold metal-dependent hydrolase